MAERPTGSSGAPGADAAAGAPGEAGVAAATRALLARVRAQAGPEAVIGWKIGINDPRMMRRLGLARSVVGVLRRDALLADGPLPVAPDAKIAVEAEIALFVAREVRGGTAPDEAARALAGIGPALEVLDFATLGGDLAAAIAGNVFHVAALFASDAPSADPAALAGLRVTLEGPDALRTLAPDAALGGLGEIVALVADRLDAAGERLRAGDRILSGAFAPPVGLAPGQRLAARFGDLGALAVVREARRVRGESGG